MGYFQIVLLLLATFLLSTTATFPSANSQQLNYKNIREDGFYCYDNNNYRGCGPNHWHEPCQTGIRQSPMNLPAIIFPNGMVNLRLRGYKSGSSEFGFLLKNTGNTVQIVFKNENSNLTFPFPDPIDNNKVRQYKFEQAHLHWSPGPKNGSEHCINGQCSLAEIHFVHSLTSNDNPNDESRYAVLGLLLNGGRSTNHPVLAPIIRNLYNVCEPHSEAFFEETIDFTDLLLPQGRSCQVYTYKGSLTTPNCDELVNWYVIKEPVDVSQDDLKMLRTSLKNNLGEVMSTNYRHTQPLNGRTVNLRVVQVSG